jgi:hypothetical protein
MHAAMQLGYILWATHVVGLYNLTKLLDMLIMRILQRKKDLKHDLVENPIPTIGSRIILVIRKTPDHDPLLKL